MMRGWDYNLCPIMSNQTLGRSDIMSDQGFEIIMHSAILFVQKPWGIILYRTDLVLGYYPLWPSQKITAIIFISSQASELELVKQLQGHILPITPMTMPIKARKITEEERNVSVFRSMRVARANKRLLGIRAKRAKDKAQEEMLKKK